MFDISEFRKELNTDRKIRPSIPSSLKGDRNRTLWTCWMDLRKAHQLSTQRDLKHSPFVFHQLLLELSKSYACAFHLADKLKIRFEIERSTFAEMRHTFNPYSAACSIPANKKAFVSSLASKKPTRKSFELFKKTVKYWYPFYHDLLHRILTKTLPQPDFKDSKATQNYLCAVEAFVVQIESLIVEELYDLYPIFSEAGILWKRNPCLGIQDLYNAKKFNKTVFQIWMRLQINPSKSSKVWMPRYLKHLKAKKMKLKKPTNGPKLKQIQHGRLTPEDIEKFRIWVIDNFCEQN